MAARRPSSSPAWASTKAPAQIETRRRAFGPWAASQASNSLSCGWWACSPLTTTRVSMAPRKPKQEPWLSRPMPQLPAMAAARVAETMSMR